MPMGFLFVLRKTPLGSTSCSIVLVGPTINVTKWTTSHKRSIKTNHDYLIILEWTKEPESEPNKVSSFLRWDRVLNKHVCTKNFMKIYINTNYKT